MPHSGGYRGGVTQRTRALGTPVFGTVQSTNGPGSRDAQADLRRVPIGRPLRRGRPPTRLNPIRTMEELPVSTRCSLTPAPVKWWLLGVVATASLLCAAPARAESPCDSGIVIPADREALRDDCEALWAFYTGLDDPGVLDDPDNPNAWGSTTPFADWQGVSVGRDGVVAVILGGAGLSGPLSPALAELTDLSTLRLERNQLTGPVPSEFGRLTKLAYLNLHSNLLSGELPAGLGQLANLTSLVLHTNWLTGPLPPELGRLSKLTFLDLGGNRFTGMLPPEMGNLASLTYLVIHNSEITGPIPPEFGGLAELRRLHLPTNKLTGRIPPELGDLTKLEVLSLRNNQLTGTIPAELGQLTNLTKLWLANNGLEGPIPASLGDLENLTDISLGGNQLTGRVPTNVARPSGEDAGGAAKPTESEPDAKFSADPLGLIAYSEVYREYSLGTEVWDVWLCDIPIGDLTLDHRKILRSFAREVAPYFHWLSNDRYRPEFEYKGDVEGEDRGACERAAKATPTSNRLLVIDDTSYAGGYASGDAIVVGGASVATAPGWSGPVLATVSHEMGHAMGFPHSFGGKIRWSNGEVYEGDNPMDLVSGQVRLDLNTATIAVNRYAAGWISPENVVIHPAGTTEVYELRPPGLGGLQMLVLPTKDRGVFTTLGARIGVGYDLAIPRQGVEVYRIDQRPSACKYPSRGACWGTNRRTKPYPPAEPGAGDGEQLYGRRKARLTQHVHSVGDVFEVGPVEVEIVERVGNFYMVRVADSSVPPPDPEPSYDGRFSDDDSNVHRANIEKMAELGITVGCNPPDNDRYCPRQVVKRSQMMAFLARALGDQGNPEVTTSRFSDVPDNAWYLSSLERLADLGVAEPDEDGAFRPSDPLTRVEMAIFLARAFPAISEATEPEGVFVDVPADAAHAGAVEGILAAGVTKGCSANPLSYCPDEPVPRDQMASFLVRALAAGARHPYGLVDGAGSLELADGPSRG